ncbi:hypothetical protein AOCH_004515 [Aspergillus ochraceoroseus]|uniref:Sulfatase N-terminal domain-containing protein n=1 Tax=Aspergillus ochraceoroseus TaxID=138278 RepID=A0A0F8X724_9EURO|nr:hypothetical protein AOCH_004515 [Aspergillus ochraceoroseus]
MSFNRPVGNEDYTQSTVVIIGAGISGMCMAIELLRHQCRNFVILEKGSAVGGTWNDNRYPGCACDVWSALYSFSFEQRTTWTREYPGQEEILDYLKGVAGKYGLYSHIRFNSTVNEARWDEDAHQWKIQVGVSGVTDSQFQDSYELSANILISAVGQLNVPSWPSIPGMDDFKGKSMHSARWDWTYDFRGKRVAVIGNGATAVQIVPEVAKRAAQVSVYQRTAQWIVPRMDTSVHPVQQFLLSAVPPLRWCKRALMMNVREQSHDPIANPDSALTKYLRQLAIWGMKKGLPDKPELLDALTPSYPPGCRRILTSDDYYPTLNKEHVRLETRPVQRITALGIETADGEMNEVDLIVYATGFRTVEFLYPMNISGARGRTLSEIWDGGATAYYGMTVEDMPNFGMLFGPNTNLGHNSIILMIEAQSRYLATLWGPIIRAKAQGASITLQPRGDTVRAFNHKLQARLAKSSFANPTCSSWYKTADGRIINNWPGTVVEYQKLLSRVEWTDYQVGGDSTGEYIGRHESTRIGRIEEEWPIRKSSMSLAGMAVALVKFFLWGITFFTQDVALTLLTRISTQKFATRWMDAIGAIVVIPFSLLMSGMTSANISFYVVAGAEINWRQARTFHRDAAAIRTLLTGLTGFLIVEAILSALAWIVAPYVHRLVGGIFDVLAEPFKSVFHRPRPFIQHIRIRNQPLQDPEVYEQIAWDDYADYTSDDDDEESVYPLETTENAPELRKRIPLTRRLVVWLPMLFLVILRSARPSYPSYMFLSETLPVAPFMGKHPLTLGEQAGNPADYAWLEGRTSLAMPPAWDWMPSTGLPGFEDWDTSNRDRTHYSPAQDPLHMSNLHEPVLDSLREVLAKGDINIKHVMVLKLESTRGDVFPLRNGSFLWNKIVDSFAGDEMPESAGRTVANLTRTAEYLTGFDSGFDQYRVGERKAYGGISASNAFTTGTYTLKSLVGTICGVSPLVADFNREYEHHIYQPCMPHVLHALSQQRDITNKTDDYRTWPWHSVWMQSVTDTYDNQDKLTPRLGYHDIWTKERIEDPSAKHYPLTYKEVNYYGYPDTELRDYIRDAIDVAKRNNTRLFLTHLTGTTHHPWGMPNNTYEKIMAASFKGQNGDLNRYLNTIGFADRWLAQILEILQEKGIADETLLVLAGDHGISLPNDGGVTPYNNPHIGSFHVPIVFAHPGLPAIEVQDPVISLQIVPTILDLLIESSSLGPDGTRVATDIRALYEGQSMIRPLSQPVKEMEDWQFSVMNTGASWLAWRFSDIGQDPLEKDPITSFNFNDMAAALWERYGDERNGNNTDKADRRSEQQDQDFVFAPHPPPPGPPRHHAPPPPISLVPGRTHHGESHKWEPEAVRFVRDAAHIAEWWIQDNWRRYGYLNKHKE